MFSMRHLQVFLAVVDAGCSVSAAAEKLHVAQPAVSKTLADLDAHFGTVLFERLNRRLRLSDAGARLLVEARQLVDSFTLLDHGMRLGTDRLPLRVGATHTVGAVFLPRLLVRRDAGACPLEVQVFNTPRWSGPFWTVRSTSAWWRAQSSPRTSASRSSRRTR